jgi:hypothetical protein
MKLATLVATAVLLSSGYALAGEGAPVPGGSVISPEDAAPDDAGGTGSAKMGEGEGTQSGDQGTTKENDTQKVGQPPRRNPTTNNGDSSPEQ